MHWSKGFFPTLRDDPADAEAVSHKLLVRAGFVRQLAAGLYSLLPLGQRTCLKVAGIVRQEMDRIGAQEFLLPALLPAEHVEADVRHDAVKPRAQRRAALEAVVSPPRAQHRLLHGVLGLERRPEHAVGVRGQLTSVSLEIELQFLGRANHALHLTTDRR